MVRIHFPPALSPLRTSFSGGKRSSTMGELGSDPVAEEGGDVFGFDSEDGLPGKLLIEGFEDGWRAEHQIATHRRRRARRAAQRAAAAERWPRPKVLQAS
jgi:hypothetical protein